MRKKQFRGERDVENLSQQSLVTTWSNIQGWEASGWIGRKGFYEECDG